MRFFHRKNETRFFRTYGLSVQIKTKIEIYFINIKRRIPTLIKHFYASLIFQFIPQFRDELLKDAFAGN